MSRELLLIGVGPGDPGQLTRAAAEAIGSVDVFLHLDKGGAAAELAAARRAIVEAVAADPAPFVDVPDPPRDRRPADYDAEVRRWHAARVDALAQALLREVPEGGRAGMLLWGDPTLYDSSVRLARALAGVVDLRWRVLPGISAVSALAAAHGVALNEIGEPVLITTGRRLTEVPAGTTVVVMLDSHCRFREVAAPDDEIVWGAYLGLPGQLLVAGRVGDVADEIVARRAAARAERGWCMDTYLLRRPVE